jgi:hypothetical protein
VSGARSGAAGADGHEARRGAVVFARRVFLGAGVYGLVAVAPQYFLERTIAERFPPAITHPEHYYGFLGVTLAWQLAFLLIARDPVRFRPLMLVAAVEKLAFAPAVFVLFARGRVAAAALPFAAIDLVLCALFLLAWRRLDSAGSG